jgi:hypothetical protein
MMRQVPEAIREGKRWWVWFKWGYNVTLIDKKLCKVYRVIWNVWDGTFIAIYEIHFEGYPPPDLEFLLLEFLFGSHWGSLLEKARKLEKEEERKILEALKEDLGINL